MFFHFSAAMNCARFALGHHLCYNHKFRDACWQDCRAALRDSRREIRQDFHSLYLRLLNLLLLCWNQTDIGMNPLNTGYSVGFKGAAPRMRYLRGTFQTPWQAFVWSLKTI